jgi:bifunctional enzyme CysN/CysC
MTSARALRIVLIGAPEGASRLEQLLGACAGAGRGLEILRGAEAAPQADAALVVVDATQGSALDRGARRAAARCGFFGVRHLVLALDRADAGAWREDDYVATSRALEAAGRALGFDSVHCLPLSLAQGDNVGARGARMPWVRGPTLLAHLEAIALDDLDARAFRMPVAGSALAQDGRAGFRGRIAAGRVRPGDRVRVLPSGVQSRVARIEGAVDASGLAHAGETVTLVLADDLEATRGQVLTEAASPVEVADQFEARLLWLSEHALIPGRTYPARIHCGELEGTVTEIKYRAEAGSGAHLAAKTLQAGDTAVVNLSVDREVPFEPFAANRALGAFEFFDRASGEILGAATIDFALRRATNVHWQAIEVTPAARQAIKGQRARCFWFTGLPSSGKSTVANLLEKRLHAEGLHTYLLDGDNVRHGLNRDLGFTEADRVENIRRVTEVARLMVDAGLVVLVSFISPFRAERSAARKLFKPGDFIEVFVDAPLAVCEQRDPKGLYAKARAGNLANFTGIDSPYEPPEQPEARIDTTQVSAAQAAERLAGLALRG